MCGFRLQQEIIDDAISTIISEESDEQVSIAQAIISPPHVLPVQLTIREEQPQENAPVSILVRPEEVYAHIIPKASRETPPPESVMSVVEEVNVEETSTIVENIYEEVKSDNITPIPHSDISVPADDIPMEKKYLEISPEGLLVQAKKASEQSSNVEEKKENVEEVTGVEEKASAESPLPPLMVEEQRVDRLEKDWGKTDRELMSLSPVQKEVLKDLCEDDSVTEVQIEFSSTVVSLKREMSPPMEIMSPSMQSNRRSREVSETGNSKKLSCLILEFILQISGWLRCEDEPSPSDTMQPPMSLGGLLSEKKTRRPEPDSPVEEEIPFMTESVAEPVEGKSVMERQRSFPLPGDIPSPPPAPVVHRQKNKAAPPPPVQVVNGNTEPVTREGKEEKPVARTPSPDVRN